MTMCVISMRITDSSSTISMTGRAARPSTRHTQTSTSCSLMGNYHLAVIRQLTICCPICRWNTRPISKRSMKTPRTVKPPLSVLNCCATCCSCHTPNHSPSVAEGVAATTAAGAILTMKTRRSTAFASITHILINPHSNVNDKLWLQINKKLRK